MPGAQGQQQQQQGEPLDVDDMIWVSGVQPGTALVSMGDYAGARSAALRAAATAGLQAASSRIASNSTGCTDGTCTTATSAAGAGATAATGATGGRGGGSKVQSPKMLYCSNGSELQAYTRLLQQVQQLQLQIHLEEQLGGQLIDGLVPGDQAGRGQGAGLGTMRLNDALAYERGGGGHREGKGVDLERRIAQYRLAHALLRSGQRGVGMCHAVEVVEEGAWG